MWSNHRLKALQQMLYEQEEIDDDMMEVPIVCAPVYVMSWRRRR